MKCRKSKTYCSYFFLQGHVALDIYLADVSIKLIVFILWKTNLPFLFIWNFATVRWNVNSWDEQVGIRIIQFCCENVSEPSTDVLPILCWRSQHQSCRCFSGAFGWWQMFSIKKWKRYCTTINITDHMIYSFKLLFFLIT